MIKWVLTASAVGVGFAFAAGAYVGWKTTLKVVESVDDRKQKQVKAKDVN